MPKKSAKKVAKKTGQPVKKIGTRKAAKKAALKSTPALKTHPVKQSTEAKIVKAEIVGSDNPSEGLPLFTEKTRTLSSTKKSPKKNESKALVESNITHDPIQMYLREVRKYPLLTREQEFDLAKKYYESKDPLAAQALITSNLRFVIKVAAEYSKFGARLIDLVQEGNMGLMHAVRDFNPYKGVRLITYAVWWIRGYIQEYLMKQYSLVKIGTTHNQRKLFYRLQKEKQALDAMGHNQAVALIGTQLGIPKEEIEEMAKRMSSRDLSLNQPLDENSKSQMIDLQRSDEINPDEALARAEELDLLKAHLAQLEPSLNEKEKIILHERLLADEPLTLQEIGEKYGITREAVRQVEARLMQKIRERIVSAIKG